MAAEDALLVHVSVVLLGVAVVALGEVRALEEDLPHALEGRDVLEAADVREARLTARRADGERVRLELVIARDPTRWSVFALLGNRPDPDPLLVDAINRRAFEIVIASFTDRVAAA